MTEGKIISCRAAVVWGPNEPFKLETIEVDPPQKGEIRIQVIATSIVGVKLLCEIFET